MSAGHAEGHLHTHRDVALTELRMHDGTVIALMSTWGDTKAQRLVTCWNACSGLSTEQMQSILDMGSTLADRLEAFHTSERELMGARDLLLEALKDIAEHSHDLGAVECAQAAIDLVDGADVGGGYSTTQPSKYGSPEMQALIVGDFRKPAATYVQVNPCTRDGDGVTRCETHEAHFFGVYVGCPGEYAWVADFFQGEHALLFAKAVCARDGYELEDNT